MDDIVLKELYNRSLSGTGDSTIDMGIRVAVLANRLAPIRFFEQNPALSAVELQRLATEGAEDELEAMLTNPMTRSYVGQLYRRQHPFDSLADDRFCRLVNYSILNPRLAYDDGTDDGPDMTLMNISKGVYEMLSTCPVNRQWLLTLNYLLFNYLPASTIGEKNALQVIDRWRTLDIKAFNSEKSESGSFTELKMTEEFCFRVAAMFGRYFEGRRFETVGTADSHDVVLRCAYYGLHNFKPNEMKVAYEKDKKVFLFAALHNLSIYTNRATRATLESMLILHGYQVEFYSTICKKLAEMGKWFDPSPINDDFKTEEVELQKDPTSQFKESIEVGSFDY